MTFTALFGHLRGDELADVDENGGRPDLETPSATQRFSQLSRHERRRIGILAALRIMATTALLLVVYALFPVSNITKRGEFVHLIVALVVLAAVIAWQIRSILRAEYPQLRAIEAVTVAIPVLIILFALLYLGLAQAHPENFSEPLTRAGSLYFTVTVLATVGFGDITARTDTARIVVTIQMLLDLAFIALLVRVFIYAAREGSTRRREAR